MLSFSPTIRVFISTQATDMRRQIDGLCGCVEQQLGMDPVTGDVFVFFNRRRSMVKFLFWQEGGFCLFCKRLAQGRFMLRADASSYEADMAEVVLILSGIDLEQSRRRKRFSLSCK